MSSTSERVRGLVLELERSGVRLWLDERGAHAEPADALTPELREELRALKSEVVEYLVEQGEQIVDDEDRAHSDMRTPPRTPEDAEQQRADADRTREAARRRYQGGAVLINDHNNFGRYMAQLRRQREASEAAERGDAPPQRRYKTAFNVFE
jgi:hypothetical protein